MFKDEALAKLKAMEPALRASGIAGLFLFGSVARNEASAASDIDLFFDRAPGARIGFALAKIKSDIEAALGVSVDFAPRSGLHPLIRHDVEANAVQVF